jgi:hypothetical protein
MASPIHMITWGQKIPLGALGPLPLGATLGGHAKIRVAPGWDQTHHVSWSRLSPLLGEALRMGFPEGLDDLGWGGRPIATREAIQGLSPSPPPGI